MTIGNIIDESAARDAIHLAVEPVTAGEKLFPGQDIGLSQGIATTAAEPLGIVDPFLKHPVVKGDMFWLVVYPRQITSLRHVWEHPAFDEQPVATSLSKEWIKTYAQDIGLSYAQLMVATDDWITDGEYLRQGGLLEGVTIPDEFWMHYQHVTGCYVPENRQTSFFSCVC